MEKLPENVRLKISKTLKGRKVSEDNKINYIKGAVRDKIKFILSQYISYRLDKDKPVNIKFKDINYKVYFKSK
jgi:hypothetical protein